MLDPYGRKVVSMWIPGKKMSDLRAMIQIIIPKFREGFKGSETIRVKDRFDAVLSSQVYKAKGAKQPKDLYALNFNSREKGYHVSMVEPNPAKAKFVQIYAKMWVVGRDGEGCWQEVMHLIYKDNNTLVELRYVPECL